MITIETTAKTVQKAIEEGLLKLNKSIDEVDIKIISSGGLFKKAKVEISFQEEQNLTNKINENKQDKNKDKPNAKSPIKPEEKKEQSKPLQNEPQQKQNTSFKSGQNSPEQKTQAQPKHQLQKHQKSEVKQENKSQPKPEKDGFKQNITRSAGKADNHDRQSREFSKNDHPAQKADSGAEKPDARGQRAKTEITDEVAKQAFDYVENLLKKMNVKFALSSTIIEGDLKINIECDSGAVIGYRGETLDSIEYLTSLAVNKNDDRYYRIIIDCNDYRSKRIEMLSGLANRMADKAVKTGRKVVLEPMSSSSRKIIHSVLSANDRIITKSEGKEPNRRIIIIPKRYRHVNEK